MNLVKATTESATRGLDVLGNRYTAMIAGFAGSAMMREFAQVDRRMTRIGIAAEKDARRNGTDAEWYSGRRHQI